MEQQTVERLKALWKSGRDKYRSFYTVLDEVKKEIGDKALADWCRTELHIGLSIINNAVGILNKTDANAVRKEMEAAVKLERQRVKRERDLERRYKQVKKKPTKLNKAMGIVQSRKEQNLPVKAKELAKEYPDIKETTFHMAIQVSREFVVL